MCFVLFCERERERGGIEGSFKLIKIDAGALRCGADARRLEEKYRLQGIGDNLSDDATTSAS